MRTCCAGTSGSSTASALSSRPGSVSREADTLVYVDLPLATHYWWVTKRLIKGLFATPEGWPDNSPMWSSTMDSYRVIWRCHRRLTPGTGSLSRTRRRRSAFIT